MLLIFLFFFIHLSQQYRRVIISDHEDTKSEDLSESYIEKIKEKIAIHIAFNTYGSAVAGGLSLIHNSQLNYTITTPNGQGSFPSLPETYPPTLRVYSGMPPDDLLTSPIPQSFWEDDDLKKEMEDLLDEGNIQYSMFLWNGELLSADKDYVYKYLDMMDYFDRKYDGKGCRMIFATDHVPPNDYTGSIAAFYTDEERQVLQENNDRIRRYVKRNGKLLFDFADIESHNSDGEECVTNSLYATELKATDSDKPLPVECSWGGTQYCVNSGNDRIQYENCRRQAIALWALISKSEGWKDRFFLVFIPTTLFVGLVCCCCFCISAFCVIIWGCKVVDGGVFLGRKLLGSREYEKKENDYVIEDPEKFTSAAKRALQKIGGSTAGSEFVDSYGDGIGEDTNTPRLGDSDEEFESSEESINEESDDRDDDEDDGPPPPPPISDMKH